MIRALLRNSVRLGITALVLNYFRKRMTRPVASASEVATKNRN